MTDRRRVRSPGLDRAAGVRIGRILGWLGDALEAQSEVWTTLGSEGIGHRGQFFLLRPDAQLGYIVDFARRLDQIDVDARGCRTVLAALLANTATMVMGTIPPEGEFQTPIR